MAITGKKISELDPITKQALLKSVSPQGCVIVQVTDDVNQNGINLLTAYREAKNLQPNGLPLDYNNRGYVIVPPGEYCLNEVDEGYFAPLLLDTDYVDIIGLTNYPESQHIYATVPQQDMGVVMQNAYEVSILNLKISCSISQSLLSSLLVNIEGDIYDDLTSSVPAAYFPALTVNGEDTVIKNCIFVQGDPSLAPPFNEFDETYPLGFSTRCGVEYAGEYHDCVAGEFSFGFKANASGTFVNCTSGGGSFGTRGGSANGKFYNCRGEAACFGSAGNASGEFYNCTGSHFCFGAAGNASGKFYNCTGGEMSFGAFGDASGYFYNCRADTQSFGYQGILSGTLHFCVADGVSGSGGVIKASIIDNVFISSGGGAT